MDGFSTITQKGQVAIPKSIRDCFHLKPFDKVRFSVEDDKIIAKKVHDIDAMFGFIPAKKPLSKKKMKQIIRDSVIEKYIRKNANNS